MLRHRAPEIGEAFDEVVFLRQSCLEIGVGMHVELDGQARVENHLHRRVEIAEIFRAAVAATRGVHHRLRIHAEPHMIEPGGLDQRNVRRGGPGFEMFLGVSLGIVDLREPFAEIDAVANVGEA